MSSRIALLITGLAVAATAVMAATFTETVRTVADAPAEALAFLLLTIALQFFAVEVHGSGRIGVAGIGMLASGFTLGIGPAVAIALVTAVVNLVVSRGRVHRAVFDAAQFALATAGAAFLYQTLTSAIDARVAVPAALAAGLLFTGLNHVFLCTAIGLSEGMPARKVWEDRFRWARFHLLSFGPLAYAAAEAYEAIGLIGLIAFTLPPALLLLSFRQYVERTRTAINEARAANEALRGANLALETSNEDLRELLQFTGGLAARTHNRGQLVQYVEETLAGMTGVAVRVGPATAGNGRIVLDAGGSRVASLELDRRMASERWERLRDAVLPQLATALESAELAERVRKTHLATIAALSRSMEAKDGYTGGHTERVASIAIAVARRLGYWGEQLDAIEVGALLHDIGKIGIPERILHKPGPLDEDEWALMKEHPKISEYILSGIDLPPEVLQIARSSHERIDGKGYPDGLAGDQIPLPARIALVADAWDALTSDRAYRKARHPAAALPELRANAGTQFCPTVIAALERVYSEEPEVLGAGLRAVA